MPIADTAISEGDVTLTIHTPRPALHHISIEDDLGPMTGLGLGNAAPIAVMVEQLLRLLRGEFLEEEFVVCHASL
jgi:hypothetical protein